MSPLEHALKRARDAEVTLAMMGGVLAVLIKEGDDLRAEGAMQGIGESFTRDEVRALMSDAIVTYGAGKYVSRIETVDAVLEKVGR